MYSKVLSGAALGIDAIIVSVETDISQGLPGLNLVGYLASSVKEAGDRVRAALKNAGYFLPQQKITTNLSPADIRKDGTNYDLAISVSILVSMGEFPISNEFKNELEETIFLGELALNGSILPVSGVLPIVDYAARNGVKRVVIPEKNCGEASFVSGVSIIPVNHITDIIDMLAYNTWAEEYEHTPEKEESEFMGPDLGDVKGQETMKRGLVLAVAGFHNIIMTGAAGSGKSMIASCIPGIMPEMTYDEKMELTKIYSVAEMTGGMDGLMDRRPFRAPGQSITEIAMCGGGAVPKPGEVSLANGGVLFLDEFPQYKKNVIESLRQPMEDRKVSISRYRGVYTFPARFMLVSARNNCPCGFYPDRNRCRCTAREICNYQNRISHPVMDRIDIRLEVRPVSFDELSGVHEGMDSHKAREIIAVARRRQEVRYKNESFIFNSEIPQSRIEKYIVLSEECRDRIREIYDKTKMSARSYYRMLRLIRTIADIEDREEIKASDVDEAVFFRNESEIKEGLLC